MVVGTVAAVTAQLANSSEGIGFDPMGIGLSCSIVAMVVGSLLTQRSHPVPEHVSSAVRETARVAPVPARMAVGEDSTLATQRPDEDGPR
jgi:sodium/proline symporter